MNGLMLILVDANIQFALSQEAYPSSLSSGWIVYNPEAEPQPVSLRVMPVASERSPVTQSTFLAAKISLLRRLHVVLLHLAVQRGLPNSQDPRRR
jgi:hypothetical protein